MKTYVHIDLAEFLECEMFQIKVVEKIETYIFMFTNFFFLKIMLFMR